MAKKRLTIRDRIKDFRRVKASEIFASPHNWRTHPQAQQDALRGILEDVGYADALLARELPDGTLELVDGHLRKETTPDQEVPVLVLDIDEDEAKKLLTVIDPLGAMAEANTDALGSLLAEIGTESDALQAMLDGLSGDNGEPGSESAIKSLDLSVAPAMSWALIGVPLDKYGDINELVERIAEMPDAIVEVVASDKLAN